ncbi:Hypothetical predicted protein [Mytilus galloprovincialis]|uniref:Vitellogenin domain-containing protein n=1 Tax=Mytilus galloprovincialis TaxID=29158 RepID=A0A8B6FNW0_MYTGA|nr:Hypothetical predicted protein [Mytilus galloprovincialis]
MRLCKGQLLRGETEINENENQDDTFVPESVLPEIFNVELDTADNIVDQNDTRDESDYTGRPRRADLANVKITRGQERSLALDEKTSAPMSWLPFFKPKERCGPPRCTDPYSQIKSCTANKSDVSDMAWVLLRSLTRDFVEIPGFQNDKKKSNSCRRCISPNHRRKTCLHGDSVYDNAEMPRNVKGRRFSFQITPNGQILKVYHPPEDDEVLATKKGLAAMLSAKLHDKDELQVNIGEWKYQTEEIGNEGPHSARYIVKDTTTETEFKKIRNSKFIEHSKGYFEKTLYYHKKLGILHKVLIQDNFTAMTGTPGFDPHQNMRKVQPVNQFSDMEYPEMTVLSKGELIFLTSKPVEDVLGRPVENLLTSSIHVDKFQRKRPIVDIDKKKEEIENNIICIKNEPAEGSPMVTGCFMEIVKILEILPDTALTEIAEFYLLKLNLRLQENRQSTVIMLDAFGSMETNISREVIAKMIFLQPNPDPDLIVQYMIHIVSSHQPPHPVILQSMEDICFHPEKYPASFYVGNLYGRVMLAMGAAAKKLFDSGEIERAKNITSRVQVLLGMHDPWLYRQKRSTQSEVEQEEYDKKHVILLETLGNAAIDHSYEYIVSHINATNSPWIKRAGVHALRKYNTEVAVEEIFKAAMNDENEEVRYEAYLIYQAHPKSVYNR